VVGYNKRKYEILELVEIGYETSSEIAEACGISQTCASTLLKRYWDWGLLNRYTGHLNNEKIYSLTDRGLERLNYLRETVYERMDEEEISHFLSNIKRCRVNKHLKRDAI
jgi:DNA-binding MarR family transcriptional regulator